MQNQKDEKQAQTGFIQSQTKIIPNHFNECFSLINGSPIYDFSKCLVYLEWKGKEIFGEKFKIYPEDHKIIYKLLLYIIGDKENAPAHGLTLTKGLLVTGPIGCGKTSLMKLLRFFQPPDKRYLVRSCREISFDFIRDGYDVIQLYTYGHAHESFKTYCFDDLGTENNFKYYGNECNVMGEIILSRYELFVTKGILTHITTNCNSLEIENLYGNRVRSRMREMFNLIPFVMHVKDKRG
ncbi:MAG: ATPase [Dyadobacter sp.]